jgi:hypothetical protein
MATLKANGGAVRFYRYPANGTRLAVCANGRVLINPGGANGWKRSRLAAADIASLDTRPPGTKTAPTNTRATAEAHPDVPGSPICGMRMPCGGRLRRAREGIEWLRAIGVSTVPRGPKGRRTATGMPTSGSGTQNWKPSPVSDFARHPYMLMNLGQRDEPPTACR